MDFPLWGSDSHSASSHVSRSGSCFHRGGLEGLVVASTCSSALRFVFEISSSVQVGRVQSSVSKPISDDGHIDAGCNQLGSDAVSKRVWADAFSRERWCFLGCRPNILLELESYSCRTERSAIAIHEDRFIIPAGPAPQQCSQQIHRFRP